MNVPKQVNYWPGEKEGRVIAELAAKNRWSNAETVSYLVELGVDALARKNEREVETNGR